MNEILHVCDENKENTIQWLNFETSNSIKKYKRILKDFCPNYSCWKKRDINFFNFPFEVLVKEKGERIVRGTIYIYIYIFVKFLIYYYLIFYMINCKSKNVKFTSTYNFLYNFSLMKFH